MHVDVAEDFQRSAIYRPDLLEVRLKRRVAARLQSVTS